MSTRDQLIQRATDIIDHQETAERVIDAVLPQITTVEQMAQVPAGSLLTTETRPGATVYRWDGRYVHEWDSRDDDDAFFPSNVIEDEGPLTVVWQP